MMSLAIARAVPPRRAAGALIPGDLAGPGVRRYLTPERLSARVACGGPLAEVQPSGRREMILAVR